MEALFVKIITLLICWVPFNQAANILAIMPMASPSHHIWNSPLVIALANRGHNLTVVSPIGQKTPVANFTDLVITGLMEETAEEYDYEEMSDLPPFVMTSILFDFVAEQCIKTMKNNAWKQLMDYPPETKFDLVIIEAIGTECLLGILPRFGNPPIVSVLGFTTPPWIFERTGTPKEISYNPHHMHSASDHMDFWQRVTNLAHNIYSYILYHYVYLPKMDKVAREFYGPHTPSFREIEKQISIEMVNFHPALDYPYPTAPNLISVAGIQVKDPKPLPKDLQQFLDDAKDGVVYFSLGSNLQSKNLKPEKREAILQAFSEIPQKVLWKFEDDKLPGQPKNVKIGKWLPQSDILAHPNVRVFVTHSGLLSTHEAMWRGVPLVGVPVFADQPMNAAKIAARGAGVRLDYKDLTKETLLAALRAVLHDPSYRRNMALLSARVRDDPQPPLERAVFWTEYALRHGGAPHLRSAAAHLSSAQYYLLDVLAALLAAPLLLAFLLCKLCASNKSTKATKQKQN